MAQRDKYLNKFHKTHKLDTEYLYKKFRNKVVFETRKVEMIITTIISILTKTI